MDKRDTSNPWVDLHFLGGYEIECCGIRVVLETRKTYALFAYLVLNPQEHSREKLAGLLWGDLPEESARRNLRHALWDLRAKTAAISQSIGLLDPIISNAETIAFNRQIRYTLDVETFQALTKRKLNSFSRPTDLHAIAELQQAVDLYRGELLCDLSVKDAVDWEEWVLIEREGLRSQALLAYETLTQVYTHQSLFSQALECAQQQLVLDPWRETAHRQLMLLLALTRQRPKALAQYEECRRLLHEEMGVEPSLETRELCERIRSNALLLIDQTPFPVVDSLPAQPDAFIGRTKELAEIASLLDNPVCRLITLVGPGGIGKTRLALEAAAHGQHRPVYFLSLAPIHQPENIINELIDRFKIASDGSKDLKLTLLEYLRSIRQPVLIFLDNFEHLIPAAALVSEILSANPGIQVLVTSRELLHLRGERGYPVPPLSHPDPDPLPPLETVIRTDGIALFLERARQARHDFRVTDQNIRDIVRICARLDGLPLAIELAAAWMDVLSPQAVLAHLAERSGTRILNRAALDTPDRHQTLDQTIAWSYHQVNCEERSLFARLSVFAGGWSVEAAEAVAVSRGSAPSRAFENLVALFEKSLLRRVDGNLGEPRFAMLETIREYAFRCLEQTGLSAVDETRELHALFFLNLAERARSELKGPNQSAWLERLAAETGNFRAALQWSLDGKHAELGLQLVAALWRYWYIRGDLIEGRHWLQAFLSQPGTDQSSSPSPFRAEALKGAGTLARNQGDFLLAQAWLSESLSLFQDLGDARCMAEVLGSLAATLQDQGDYPQARARFEECLELYERLGDQWGCAMAQSNLAANLLTSQADIHRAQELLEKSLAIRRLLGDQTGMAYTLNNLAIAFLANGKSDRARQLCEESLQIFTSLGNKVGMATALNSLGEITWSRNDLPRAATCYEECLELCEEISDKEDQAIAFEGLAHVAMAQASVEQAVRFLGAAAALREQMRLPIYPDERGRHEQLIQEAIGLLGMTPFEILWREGENGLRKTLSEIKAVA
ncbi:MAG TPA: tetratricopeptide repeat protein [Anaerolineaceae bacterium]|nr:tetratricopeptide repeat protein [Anaerolineaceae bacterium]